MVSLLYVRVLLGRSRVRLAEFRDEARQGFFFAASLASQTLFNDLDKAILARMDSLLSTGIYTAAYRIVGMAFLPIFALMSATFGRFFKSGQKGLEGSVRLACRIIPYSATIGLLASVGLYLFAPLVPVVLGQGYVNSVDALRLLSIIPFLKSLHYFAADALSGADLQGVRTFLQAFVVIFNVVTTVALVARASWRGAAWASVLTELLLVVVMWGAALLLRRRELGAKR
jgi:O-antigen/teichoic acid export membrane protein